MRYLPNIGVIIAAAAETGVLAAGDHLVRWEQFSWVISAGVLAAVAWVWKARAG